MKRMVILMVAATLAATYAFAAGGQQTGGTGDAQALQQLTAGGMEQGHGRSSVNAFAWRNNRSAPRSPRR